MSSIQELSLYRFLFILNEKIKQEAKKQAQHKKRNPK